MINKRIYTLEVCDYVVEDYKMVEVQKKPVQLIVLVWRLAAELNPPGDSQCSRGLVRREASGGEGCPTRR